jgi:hypothetical protein
VWSLPTFDPIMMRSRHVVLWLNAVLVLGALLAATVNIMCQHWISERIDLLFIDSSSRSSGSISTAGMEKMMTANQSSSNSWDGEFKHHERVVIAPPLSILSSTRSICDQTTTTITTPIILSSLQNKTT